ncbi:hypothetical protein VPNG_07908 [Cytospora leucostoma]|uniref:Uncharacterized protein n=1 Tax=Cytospora leucostoma TaxID=1230097 RepID=A0A423WAR8_9PEZI|nr:hypothetical protein VPNG_07908 [Cytospora leucostoma]
MKPVITMFAIMILGASAAPLKEKRTPDVDSDVEDAVFLAAGTNVLWSADNIPVEGA